MTDATRASYALARTVDLSFDEASRRIRETLQEQGFGVLTEIDLQATLKKKLDHDMPHRYLILGACSPPDAKQAVETEPDIGLLLPCNVVVRESDAGTIVEAMDPILMLDVAENPDLRPLAQGVRQRLERSLDAVEG